MGVAPFLIMAFKFRNPFYKTEDKKVPGVANITEATREGIHKEVIPNFMYKPAFGYPRFVDLAAIRILSATPYVDMCITTIIDEVCSIEWDIIAEDEKGQPVEGKENEIAHVTTFFDNPNTNKESWEYLTRVFLRDVLEVDSGVIVKVFNRYGEMVEMVARDGITFTKNPDMHGMMTHREDLIFNVMIDNVENIPQNEELLRQAQTEYGHISQWDAREQAAYFQYGWITGARPIPFGKREIVWFERNPRSDSRYGRGAVEILQNVVQTLIYAIEHNLDYFSDNSIPQGVLSLEGSDSEEIEAFKEQWLEQQRVKDSTGKWKKLWHHLPIVTKPPKFEKLGFNNAELQLLEGQRWWAKLVWACFGVTPTELGFTEDAKGMANQIVQSNIFKKRAINPLLRMMEYKIDTEIISEFGYEGLHFRYQRFDVDEETKKAELYKLLTDVGIKTVNEIRREEGLDDVEWGDEDPKRNQGNNFNFPFGGAEERELRRTEEESQPPEKKPKKEEKTELKYKYIKRTGGPGNYTYWYRHPKTGKLVSGKKPKEASDITKKDPTEQLLKEKGEQKIVKDALDHLPVLYEKKYDLESAQLKKVPVKDLKPTQKGEDRINPSSEYTTKEMEKYLRGEKKLSEIRKEDLYPIIVDADSKEILDGNHRYTAYETLEIEKVTVILLKKKKEEKDIETKPFGKYENFAACVSANKGKKNPEAYCAALHKKITGKWPTEKALGAEDNPLIPKEGEQMDEEKLKRTIVYLLKQNEKKLINLLEREGMESQIINIKDVDDVIKALGRLLTFEGLRGITNEVMRNEFLKGWDDAERQLDQNFLVNERAITFMQDHTFNNIRGMTDEITQDLRAELERGIMAGEGITKLKERVSEVFDVGEVRAEAIARTETNRAEGQGRLQAWKSSGETDYMKKWVTHFDERTSAICKRLNNQKVGINENFTDKTTGWEGPTHPAHVNCRSSVIYVPKEEEE